MAIFIKYDICIYCYFFLDSGRPAALRDAAPAPRGDRRDDHRVAVPAQPRLQPPGDARLYEDVLDDRWHRAGDADLRPRCTAQAAAPLVRPADGHLVPGPVGLVVEQRVGGV